MRQFSAAPREMFASMWRNWGLIQASAKREVLGRYRGSFLGLMWSLFNPLFMLAVYTFVFGSVFGARWGSESESKIDFALILFAGLIAFNLFAECVNRAPNLILVNPNYVKRVVYPLEILPIVILMSAAYHAFISLCVWLTAYFLFFGSPQPTIVMLPLLIIPFCFFIMGITWALSSIGVFLRDVTQFIGVVTTAMLFLSAIFYPISALPAIYQDLIYLNPLAVVIEMLRDILYWGQIPSLILLGKYWLASLLTAWLGFAWFQKTRKGFADVL